MARTSHKNHTPSKTGRSLYTGTEIANRAAFIDAVCNKSSVDPAVAGYVYYTSAPPGHPDHMTPDEATQEFFPGKDKNHALYRANNSCRNIVADILFGIDRKEANLARTEKGLSPLTRKRKTRDEIETDAAARAHRLKIRQDLGLKPRGRIPLELMAEYTNRISESEHSAEVVEV